MEFFVQFAQQEHLDACSGLLLVSVKTGRKDLCIIKNEYIFLIKIVEHILENLVLNITSLFVYNHQFALIAMIRRTQSNPFLWKFKLEL